MPTWAYSLQLCGRVAAVAGFDAALEVTATASRAVPWPVPWPGAGDPVHPVHPGQGGQSVAYAARLTLEGELAFRLEGAVTFAGGPDRLLLRSIGAGWLRPGAEPGLTHGAAVCQVVGTTGRLAGTSGVVAIAFLVRDDGELTEYHLGLLTPPMPEDATVTR